MNFWNGLFGLFASMLTVLLTASVGSYFKNREERIKHKREINQKQIKPYCVALQKLIDLIYNSEIIESMTIEQKQQKREKWVLEWNTVWKEIRPLINDLEYVSNDECREQLDRAFGIIYRYVTDSTGSLQEIETIYKQVVQKCDGCQDFIVDVH